MCRSLYALGEEVPAMMAVSAVGAKDQRNEAHFIELLAGLGAIRFFDDNVACRDYSLAVAAREKEQSLTWSDLPCPNTSKDAVGRMHNKLQKMAVFAVAYHYIFYPQITEALRVGGSKTPYWIEHIERKGVRPEEARAPLAAVDAYTMKALEWLLHISTPRLGFEANMINPNVFGIDQGQNKWRLKIKFDQSDLGVLLRNRPKSKVNDGTIVSRASAFKVRTAMPRDRSPSSRLVRCLRSGMKQIRSI